MLKAHYEVKLAALKAHTDALANAADDALDPTCGCDACVLLREVVAEYRAWEADNGAR